MKKGFTLIELLGVIILLGLIGLIVIPSITKMIRNSRQDLYNNQVNMIEQTARKWGVQNSEKLSETEATFISVSELVNSGFIEQDEIKDPRDTKKNIEGCVSVTYNSQKHKYVYKYKEESCDAMSVITFANNFGGSDYDSFSDIISVSDGYIAVGGSDSEDGDLENQNLGWADGIIVKYNLTGELVWKKNFGGSNSDYFSSIIEVSDGYIVVGSSNSTDGSLENKNIGWEDGILVKYDFNGNLDWVKTYGGSNSDYFYGVAATSDGYIIVGETYSNDGDFDEMNNGQNDALIIKTDFNGNLDWVNTYGGNDYEIFNRVSVMNDTYTVVGYSYSTNMDWSNKGSSDGILVQYDSDGGIIWEQNFGGDSSENFYGIVSVNDGHVVSGYSCSDSGDLENLSKGDCDGIIAKYDIDGNLDWVKTYGGSYYESFYNIIKVSDGYVVVGDSDSKDGDLSGLNKGNYDGIIVKYDLNGNVIWKKNYGGNTRDSFYAVTIAADGGYAAVGSSYSNDCHIRDQNKGEEDAIIYKLDELGELDKICIPDPPMDAS